MGVDDAYRRTKEGNRNFKKAAINEKIGKRGLVPTTAKASQVKWGRITSEGQRGGEQGKNGMSTH